MASVIQICNIALMRIGSSRTINSLSEQSKQADVCNVFYETARDAVLSDFPWNFAAKRVVLADLGVPSSDWQYGYRYPTDCMRVIEIMVPGIRFPTPGMRLPFEVGSDSDGTGKIIYTNEAQAQLRYVGKVTDPNMFDAQFSDALSWRLAAEFSMPLSASGDLGNKALQMYNSVILSAGARSNNESQEPLVPESDVTLARLS
ncbi:hypothetical protein LLS47_12295 [Rouxiella badensis]|uniref:hypothetical protein n=1 Tax=Rouxiella badensis TaxID=1646377 RepID=UPI001D1531BE|nr:hypothetical protein [Rouxiella badensis]MCC3733708.1 hypothetical protein [Rouxiella badensis]MCC3759639.1 hypothetical protein [Rouxiella badensis]